jgi:hypothetical protein
LSGQAQVLSRGELRLRGRFCRLLGEPVLWAFEHPDFRRQRVMVIAPHADDAELAAYGLYSQADEAWIVTLTAGEIEAEHFQQVGLNKVEAARLKGVCEPGTVLPYRAGPGFPKPIACNWATSVCNWQPCKPRLPSQWVRGRRI